jgi:ferritin
MWTSSGSQRAQWPRRLSTLCQRDQHTPDHLKEISMAAKRFVEVLNAQIGSELSAHNQYVACAAYYDGLTMPQLAGLFYRQAIEERGHAMMMVQYLIDSDEPVVVPGVASPTCEFEDIIAPVRLALDQEKRVTEQINNLTRVAREENDFASEQFMQWFIKEQVEEVSSMSDLLTVVTRSRNDIEGIEDFVARETGKEGADPTAPAQAGANA